MQQQKIICIQKVSPYQEKHCNLLALIAYSQQYSTQSVCAFTLDYKNKNDPINSSSISKLWSYAKPQQVHNTI